MARWKSWKFGSEARRLPTLRGPQTAQASDCWVGEPEKSALIARRFPSTGLSENISRILNHPDRFLVKKRRDWDIHKIARLYAGEFYPIGETWEVVCGNCWVHIPSGTVISSDRQGLCDTSLAPDCLYQGHSEVSWEDAPWIEDDVFLLATVWGGNYAHWLMDSLPRLVSGPEQKLLMGRSVCRFQEDSLRLLGYAGDRLILPKTNLVRCRKLRVHITSLTSGIPHPACITAVRRRLQAAVGAETTAKRRLYISRQKPRRKILNHADVFPILQEFGFEEVFCEEMDFADQVRLFSSAEAIFGAHGAGTLNVLFAPEGSALIEAYNPQVWDHAAHRVASLLGVRHFHLFAENASKDFDVRIDPNLLARTLALALNADPPDQRLIETVF